MSILSQIGVIILIIAIIFVLIRSNSQLAKAAEEGEHFVDEWAMRELKKQELAEQMRLGKAMQKQRAAGNGKYSQGADRTGDAEAYRELEVPGDAEAHRELEAPGTAEAHNAEDALDDVVPDDVIPDNVVPIHREPEESITLLELDENRHAVREIPVTRLPFTIGRARGNDLVIDDLSIAKTHCRIIKRNRAIILLDEGSRNKVAVGDVPRTEMVLKDCLYIGIGSREFLVRIEETPAGQERSRREGWG